MAASLYVLVTHVSILLTISQVVPGFEDQKRYEFGDDCLSFTEDLKEDDQIYVEYHGKKVDSYCEYFRFRGRADDVSDDFSVCVTPIYFNDTNCSVEIEIKTSLSGVSEKKITCDESKREKYCGPEDEALYIMFDNRYGRSTSGASFNLRISAEKEVHHNGNDGIIFGGGLWNIIGTCALVLIVVCVIVFFWRLCRRNSCPCSKNRSRYAEPEMGTLQMEITI